MSTALSHLRVIKVPCYTFHDGFSTYKNLLNGVLPVTLEAIHSDSPVILKRFIAATIGWIRYKPLLVYITNRQGFEKEMVAIEQKLIKTIPLMCAYFDTKEFEKILLEFRSYRKKVLIHFNDFENTKVVWGKLIQNIATHLG